MQWNITWDIEKNEITPLAAAWINLEIVILNKVNQREEKKYHMVSLVYRI